MQVRVGILLVASAIATFVFGASFGASFTRELCRFSVSNATRQWLQPVSPEMVLSTTTGPFSPPVSSSLLRGHFSALPTVVSDITGPWFNGSQEHPCLPATGQTVVSRPGVHYFSSELEREWVSKPHHLNICNDSKRHRETALVWINYSRDIFLNTRGGPYREPSPSEAQALSVFVAGNGELQHIEPLTGEARFPDICDFLTTGQAPRTIVDIQYLIPLNLCGQTQPRLRKYFDLGCTTNGQRGSRAEWSNYDYRWGSGMGPSIPLFSSMYRDRCVEFDEIYGWEATRIDPEEWFDPIPDALRHKVHFFNLPVSENSCPQSPSGEYKEGGSFLRFLEASATVEDFVVVKVDIDGGPELEIVESIAHRYELSRLVDELYFEYHFQFDSHNFGWGIDNFKGKTVDTALNLMYRLRQAGVRSHFWI